MSRYILIRSILFLMFLGVVALLFVSTNVKVISASFHLKQVSPKVYVDPGMSQDDISRILRDLKKSKEIVGSYFDGIESSPTILFIESKEMLRKYGDISGATYDTVLGNYILFGPRGFHTEIIAHELVHAELRSRISNNKIPTWFDEGLATFIDGRFQSEINKWKIEKRESKRVYEWTTQELFRDSNDPILNRYKLAAYEVDKWYEEKGSQRLSQLISQLNDGTDFSSAYE